MADQLTPSLESSAKEFGLGLRDARGPRNFFFFFSHPYRCNFTYGKFCVCVSSHTHMHAPASKDNWKEKYTKISPTGDDLLTSLSAGCFLDKSRGCMTGWSPEVGSTAILGNRKPPSPDL